jgi:hypothetical protein|tara:strand:- start:6174 stop:6314 length:141 start_codon:yes stop_codon:yes gene_type:complete
MVRKGIRAGAPKMSPKTSEERGGRIQFEDMKLSMKNRNPIPKSARK